MAWGISNKTYGQTDNITINSCLHFKFARANYTQDMNNHYITITYGYLSPIFSF